MISITNNLRASSAKPLLKVAICVAIVGPVLWLLERHLADMDSAALAEALHAISLDAIALSFLFSAISLYAVARYDRLAIRQLGLNVPDTQATQGGFTAVSIGQTLGMGLLVGSAVRWRMYRHLGVTLPQSAMISGLVMAGFLIGFAVVLAVAVLISGDSLSVLTGASSATLRTVAALALVGIAIFAFGCLLQPRLSVRGRRIPLPGIRVLRAQITLAALDTIPAATALWVLIPGEAGPELLVLIPVYLVALGIGLVSNAPGGLGVLELACLMALPVMPPEHLLAALIAHRAIYYGVPALIAGAMLVVRELHGVVPEEPATAPDVSWLLDRDSRAETTLIHLGDKSVLTSDCGQAMVQFAQSGNSMVVLGDPIGPEGLHADMIAKFADHARNQNCAPVFYKCSETTLAACRGMARARIGLDASVDPRSFAPDGSKFRELRRKLRAAEKAGVTIVHHAPGHAPMNRLAPVAAQWANAKGGERGFSMGNTTPHYLNRQPIIEARVDGNTTGFLSLMVSGDGTEMCMDVMRLPDTAPDGTMHALVKAGIDLAAATDAHRFSFAAVPMAGLDTPHNWVERALSFVFHQKPNWHASHGLMRFKSSFRPEWTARHVMAPSLLDCALGLLDARTLIQTTPKPFALGVNSRTYTILDPAIQPA